MFRTTGAGWCSFWSSYPSTFIPIKPLILESVARLLKESPDREDTDDEKEDGENEKKKKKGKENKHSDSEEKQDDERAEAGGKKGKSEKQGSSLIDAPGWETHSRNSAFFLDGAPTFFSVPIFPQAWVSFCLDFMRGM